MENESTEKKVYDMRVIPFVKEEKIVRKGKVLSVTVNNLTKEERESISSEPRILWENADHVYMAEMPLTYNEGINIKSSLYYVFDELTSEEQERFFDKSIVIPTTKPTVVKVYGEDSKKFFSGKKRTKKRK